ncbi:MAG: hypothetical protein IJT77_08880, partial [Clostridia bacterium]|nr:hypothetical protein [Clostridia bacterium]
GRDSLQFSVSGHNESDKDTFRAICDEALAALLRDGVDKTVLDAILASRQFEELMALDDSSVYLDLAESMASQWTTFDSREVWKLDADFSSRLDEFITVENLNETATRYWSSFDTAVMAITVPVPGLKEEQDAALRARLDEMKANMTSDEVDALVEQTKAYHAFVDENNKIVMPESLNALSVETLPEEVSYQAASETSIDGVRLVTNEVDSPLIRISILNDASVIPFEDLYDFMEFTSLIGRLGTDIYTLEELPSRAACVSSGMNILATRVVEDEKTRTYYFKTLTNWFTLPNLLEESFAMVEDILYHTDFSDYDFIRSDAAQNYAAVVNSLNSSGLGIAFSTALAADSNAGRFSLYLDNADFIRYLDKISKMTDAEMDVMVGKFDRFREMVLNRNNVVMTVMANSENIIRSAAMGYKLISGFNDTKYETVDYVAMLENVPHRTGIVTGGNVVYNVAFTDIEAAGYDREDGAISVIAYIVDDKLLYPELRVKNSAYGGYTYISGNSFGLYSYRDPEVAKTYKVYETIGDFLRNLEIPAGELEGYIISVYGNLTTPNGPLTTALIGINDKIYGEDSREETLRKIRDIKAFTPDDIGKYAGLLDRFATGDAVCVTAGARSMIEANTDIFDTIDYSYMNLGQTDEAAASEPSQQP